jgi:hypothetical protein
MAEGEDETLVAAVIDEIAAAVVAAGSGASGRAAE